MAVPEQSQIPILDDTTATGGEPGDVIPWKVVPAYARKIALSFCKDGFAHLADDIAQEAAIRLFKNSNQIRTSWKGLLRRIVANVAHDLVGDEIRLRKLVRQNQAALDGSLCAGPEAPDLVATTELEGNFEAMLAELDIKFGLGTRAIVDLRGQKLPWKDVVEALGIPERTCRFRHDKAEAWLTKQLSLPPRKGSDHE
jgi:DNA-directed RNA polymerase specialized sigma24 family protein